MEITKEVTNDIVKDKTIDYISGYKVDKSYNEERIHINNLYDGLAIIGDYGAIKLLNDCVSEKVDKIEENIAILYKIFKDVCKLQDFLIEDKDELEKICKMSMIDNFSLDNPSNKSGKIAIKVFDFDNSVLYNGKGIASLEELKKHLWRGINDCLKDKKEIKIIDEKLYEALSDGEYLSDEEEISKELMKNYDKINYDRLEEISNPTMIIDKEEILKEVECCLGKYSRSLDRYNDIYLYSVALKYSSFNEYLNYVCITDIYKQLREDVLECEE